MKLSEALPLIEARLPKFAGRTLKANTDIFNVNPGDISSEQFGEFLSLKVMTKRFLWMKKGYTAKLEDEGDGFFSSSDGEYEFADRLLAELSRDRLITIK
jgi:hypothetical protein